MTLLTIREHRVDNLIFAFVTIVQTLNFYWETTNASEWIF